MTVRAFWMAVRERWRDWRERRAERRNGIALESLKARIAALQKR